MIIFLAIRAKVTEIYQKYDFIVNAALKFVLMFLSLKKAAGVIGYNTTLSGTGAVIAFSAVSAFLPSSLMVLIAAMYVFLQILTASVLIAVTVILVFLILYLFFLRFTPKEGIAVIATPYLCSVGLPYAVPLFLGLFGSVLSVVPAACGVVAYFMIKAVKNNIITIDQLKALKDQALTIYIDILDDLLNNPPMYVLMFVFAVTIIAVVLVRMMKMDFSFEISILVGTGVMMLALLIGSLMAETELKVASMVFGSLLCAGAAMLCMWFYRTLDYAGAERVQFEDERYYYYVTAVPKITAASPRRTIRKPKRPKEEETLTEDEDEAEAIEAMESLLAGNKRPYAKPLTPALAKRLRRDVAVRKDDYPDDEDEEDELVLKGPRQRGEGSIKISDVFRRGIGKIKGILPGRKNPDVTDDSYEKKWMSSHGDEAEDEESEEEKGDIFFEESADAEADEPYERGEDDYE